MYLAFLFRIILNTESPHVFRQNVRFLHMQCYPAEVFPIRMRAFAHRMSAASGKAGAIISALVFKALTDSIGTPIVLWSACFSFPVFQPFLLTHVM